MGLEEQIVQVVKQAVNKALEELKTADSGKTDDICFITPKEAAEMLKCGVDVIKAMQDAGQLSLCLKPFIPKPGKDENQNRHRLVIKSEVLEMQKKCIVKAAKKKNNHSP
jgi:hypothetical protein